MTAIDDSYLYIAPTECGSLDNSIEVENYYSYIDSKNDMLICELEKMHYNAIENPNEIVISKKIIVNALNQIKEIPSGYTKHCHVDAFAKAGPIGWKNSYSKRC